MRAYVIVEISVKNPKEYEEYKKLSYNFCDNRVSFQ